MRVLLAGATGAIGRPLTRRLVAAGHEVLALARSEKAVTVVGDLGAQPVRADAMDRDGLLRALDGIGADAVIHELTSLSKPKSSYDDNDPSTLLRTKGTANLLEAARAIGAERFVTQSMALGYGYRDHGDRILTEDDAFGATHGSAADFVLRGLHSAEEQAFAVGGIALRYGIFYGPGTWFDPESRSFPIPVPVGGGGSVPWVHVDDAASATVAALEKGRGGLPYNIVDDHSARWGDVASAVTAAGGRRAPRLPRWLLRRVIPYLGALMIDSNLRASNARAARELGWTPAYPSYREGLQRRMRER